MMSAACLLKGEVLQPQAELNSTCILMDGTDGDPTLSSLPCQKVQRRKLPCMVQTCCIHMKVSRRKLHG